MIIAGTGHRPYNLPGGFDEIDEGRSKLHENTFNFLQEKNPSLVISGGALGYDMELAVIAHGLKIPFDLYLPYRKTGENWKEDGQKKLADLKRKARRVVFTSWDYSPQCFHVRDYAMVDEADLIIACWNPEIKKGGTYLTVRDAIKKFKPIHNVWTNESLG